MRIWKIADLCALLAEPPVQPVGTGAYLRRPPDFVIFGFRLDSVLGQIMPRIPEIFRLDGADETPDDRVDLDALDPEGLPEPQGGDDPWLEALQRQAASNAIQGSFEWRCVRCDSEVAVQSGPGQWSCATCQSTDFYSTNQALRRQTDRGTWMFLPPAPNGPPRQGPPGQAQLLNKYLLAIPPAKGSQLRFPDASGNSSIGHCAGDNLLTGHPPTA